MLDIEGSIDIALDGVNQMIENIDVFQSYKLIAQSIRFGDSSFNSLTQSGFFNDVLFFSKIIAAVLIPVFLIGIIYFVKKISNLNKNKREEEKTLDHIPEPANRGMVTGKWQEIMNHMESDKENDWKLAVIEADKLMDDLLKKSGFYGDTMGERLTNMHHDQLRTLHVLWQAHRIRNRLVHETDYSPSYKELHEALKYYRAALEELGALTG